MKSFTKICGSLIFLISFTLSSHLFAQEGHIELSAFSITRMEHQVTIDWTAEKASGSAVFEVQRSSNGHVFETIARIEEQATMLSDNSYETIDTHPPAGRVQYRIKRLSANHKPQVFETLSLDMGHSGNSMKISHLLVDKQSLRFQLSNPSSAALHIQITSLSGQLIAEGEAEAGKTNIDVAFPLSSLSAGMYVLNVKNVQGKAIREKFLY